MDGVDENENISYVYGVARTVIQPTTCCVLFCLNMMYMGCIINMKHNTPAHVYRHSILKASLCSIGSGTLD